MKQKRVFMPIVAACILGAAPAPAQFAVPPPAPPVEFQFSLGLDELVEPVALYPDPLLAQMLCAATVPAEIVLADRYVSGGGDSSLLDRQPWDASVKALARYPTVLKMMDDNLAWTTDLGQAFLNQPADVMESIQHTRAQAQDFGNLKSTPQQNVIADDGIIEVLPPNPQLIYVPSYKPEVVYIERSYGRMLTSFSAGYEIGAWLDRDFDWQQGTMVLWNADYPRPADWWSRRPTEHARTEPTPFTVLTLPHPQTVILGDMVARGWYEPDLDPSYAGGVGFAPVVGEPSVTVIHPGYSSPWGFWPAFAPPSGGWGRASYPATVSPAWSGHGAFIGIGSSQQTHRFSNRGQHSRGEGGTSSGHGHSGGHGGSHGGSGRH